MMHGDVFIFAGHDQFLESASHHMEWVQHQGSYHRRNATRTAPSIEPANSMERMV